MSRLILALIFVPLIIGVVFMNTLPDKNISDIPESIVEKIIYTLGPETAEAAIAGFDYTCDGVNDNVEFQAAMNALPASGGMLQVYGGDYVFAATVTRAIPNVTIIGVGQATTFSNDGATALFTCGGNNWHFEDLQTDAGSINFGATTGWVVDNCILGAAHYSLYTESGLEILASGIPLLTISSGSLNADIGRTVISVAANSIWNTEQYDYQCDGTDDWEEINQAILKAATDDGIVRLSYGQFNIGDCGNGFQAVQLLEGVDLEGCGYGTLLYMATGVSVHAIASGSGSAGWASNTTIRNLRLYGNSTSHSHVRGISLRGDNCNVYNCWVEDFRGYGIFYGAGTEGAIENNVVKDTKASGIQLSGIENTLIQSNYLKDCGTLTQGGTIAASIGDYQGNNNSITNNIIHGGGGDDAQIEMTYGTGGLVANNVCEDGLWTGAKFQRHRDFTCINNTFEGGQLNGIDTWNAISGTVKNNTVIGFGGSDIEESGITVNGGNVTIIGNDVSFCQRNGIDVGSTGSTSSVIRLNNIRNCGTGRNNFSTHYNDTGIRVKYNTGTSEDFVISNNFVDYTISPGTYSLTKGGSLAGTSIYVADASVFQRYEGIWIVDDNSSGTKCTIASINTTTDCITIDVPLADDYTVSQNAKVSHYNGMYFGMLISDNGGTSTLEDYNIYNNWIDPDINVPYQVDTTVTNTPRFHSQSLYIPWNNRSLYPSNPGTGMAYWSDDTNKFYIYANSGTISIGHGPLVKVSDINSFNAYSADYQCDGTDDESQLNEAINRLDNWAGGTLWLYPGTYSIDSADFELSANYPIHIVGYGATLELAANRTFTISQEAGEDAAGCTIEGLVIDGGNNAGTTGIDVDDTDRATLNQCRIVNCANGLRLNNGTSGRTDKWTEGTMADNVTIYNCTYGIYFNGSAGNTSFMETYFNNVAVIGCDYGMYINSNSNLTRSRMINTGFWQDDNSTAIINYGDLKDCQLDWHLESQGTPTNMRGIQIGGTWDHNIDTAKIHLSWVGTFNEYFYDNNLSASSNFYLINDKLTISPFSCQYMTDSAGGGTVSMTNPLVWSSSYTDDDYGGVLFYASGTSALRYILAVPDDMTIEHGMGLSVLWTPSSGTETGTISWKVAVNTPYAIDAQFHGEEGQESLIAGGNLNGEEQIFNEDLAANPAGHDYVYRTDFNSYFLQEDTYQISRRDALHIRVLRGGDNALDDASNIAVLGIIVRYRSLGL